MSLRCKIDHFPVNHSEAAGRLRQATIALFALFTLTLFSPMLHMCNIKFLYFFIDRNSGEDIAGAASKHSKETQCCRFATISVSYSSFILLRS